MAYISWNNGINVEDCENTIKKYKNLELDIGTIGDGTRKEEIIENADQGGIGDSKKTHRVKGYMESTEKQRNSLVYWIQETNLLTRSLFQFMLEANDNKFRYNVFNYEQNGQNEKVQFTEYSVDNFYNWHQDRLDSSVNGTNRKLSLTVNLSNPESYEGGDLEFFAGESPPVDITKRKQGSVVVFDSCDWHRVTPVTKGVRYSLVTWLWGVDFV
jgi:PKHD-type hydroxylase